ncbi:MAG: alpha/beta fold hydrolase [Burkholderiaceae bacterium]|nr:alpha/beta fold hydrolase [Burkholderiaceae bacterium]
MLHGGEGSRRSFAKILPELSDRFTVITYDQRDCGETVSPDSPADLATLADDACALVQALGHAQAFVFGLLRRRAQASRCATRRWCHASFWPAPAGRWRTPRDGRPASAEQLADYFFPARFLADHPEYKRHFSGPAPHDQSAVRPPSAIRRNLRLAASGCRPCWWRAATTSGTCRAHALACPLYPRHRIGRAARCGPFELCAGTGRAGAASA